MVSFILLNLRFSQWIGARIALILLIVMLPLTWAAFRVYPVLDDAGIELIAKENGINAVAASMPDRPMVIWIIQHAMYSPLHVYMGMILQLLGWVLLGFLAAFLWLELFPEHREYAPVVACFTVAPILLKAQLATWTFVLPVNFSVVPAYGAGLLLWRYIRHGSSRRGWIIIAASVLTFGAGLISEYALLTTVCSSLLLFTLNWAKEREVRLRLIQSLTVLAVAALSAHLIYLKTAVAHPGFSGVSFTPSAGELISHWPIYINRLLRAFVFSTIGVYGQAIGSAAAQAVKQPSSIISIAYPLVAAVTLWWATRRHANSSSQSGTSLLKTCAALVLVIFAALAPASFFPPLFVGRDLHMEEESTRYYFVAAPLVVALTIRLALEITSVKFRFILPLLGGFLAGDAVLQYVRTAQADTQAMRAIGTVLEHYVRNSEKQTVVLAPDFYAREPELTYKASAAWSPELSRRVWIMWDMRAPAVLKGSPADRGGSCNDIRFIDRNLRTIIRRGEIGQLLWLQPTQNGSFKVEPYCLTSNQISPAL